MKNFIPDSRNFGGRKVINDEFRHHYEKMANAKSTIQTRPQNNSSFSHYNTSVGRSTMKRPTESSFRLSKGNKTLLSEHLLNIKHMNRRIQSIGSVKSI